MQFDVGYREIPHTADLGLEVRAASFTDLLIHSAAGLCGLLCCESSKDAEQCEYPVNLQAPDRESLLVAWLNEIIFLCDVHRVCPIRFEVQPATEYELSAVIYGSIPWLKHRSIKAATFHNLAVSHTAEGFRTQITFDV